MITRRGFLAAASTSALAGVSVSACSSAPVVNDISQLEATAVAGVVPVQRQADIVSALTRHRGLVCVAGGRYSMGGQTSAEQALQLNMDGYNGLVFLDVARKVVRVKAGMRWRALQDHLDRHDLSVKVMQSFSNFTVGGSVSVNCHGRYVGGGSIASTVRALQLVLRSGEVVEATRTQHAALFAGVLGGYGLLGVVSEVELDVVDNDIIERHVERVPLAEYPDWFQRNVAAHPDAVMHNADLLPPSFDAPLAITWLRTQAALTDTARLVPMGEQYDTEQNMIWALSELPGGHSLRGSVVEKLRAPRVIHRNLEASLDVAALEPRTRVMSTYLLQEYFIPVRHFHAFAAAMAKVLQDHQVNALNVSIRHAPADPLALMAWAKEPVFCFVLYYKQRRYPWADGQTVGWTRALVEAAIGCGGRYYLPYRPHATAAQFLAAYPETHALVQLKREVDPNLQLVNHLWQRYMQPLAAQRRAGT